MFLSIQQQSGSNYSKSVDVPDERNSIAFWRMQILTVIVHEWLLCLGSPAWADQRAPSEKRETQVADFVSRKPPGIRPPSHSPVHPLSIILLACTIIPLLYCKKISSTIMKTFHFSSKTVVLDLSSKWVWKCNDNAALTHFFKLCHKSKTNFA